MSEAVDDLVGLLDLEYLDVDLFRGRHPDSERQRVYGGQVAAQALEQQYDAFERAEGTGESLLASDEPLPTGEEIGQQFEQFLAGLDEDGDR